MNESKTPKIVVGVGLVAVYAGVAFYFLRDKPHATVTRDAVAQPAAPVADTSVPLPAIAATPADLATEAAAQPAVATAVVTEAPSPPRRAAATAAAPESRVSRVEPRVEQTAQSAGQRQQPAEPQELSQEPTVARQPAEVGTPDPIGELASTVGEPASPAAADASPVQEGTALSGTDSQITADVRTQIAAVAPTSDIEVTTIGGVVELSGSVPSHEDVNKVVMAARSVEHVRSVEASALMVAN